MLSPLVCYFRLMKTIKIEGLIGEGENTLDGVRAKVDALNLEKNEPFNTLMDSPGGNVLVGLSIYNFLRTLQDSLYMEGTGLVGSIATLIMSAAKKENTTISPVALFMIHKASTGEGGNADDKRKQADTLDKIDDILSDTYENRTGLPKEEILTLMAIETWFTGTEAVTAGFVGNLSKEIIPEAAAAQAQLNKSNLKTMSLKNLLARFKNEADEEKKPDEEAAKAVATTEETKKEEEPKALTEEEILKEKEEGAEEEKTEIEKINARLDGIEDSINKFAGVMSNVIDSSEAEAKAQEEKMEEVKKEASATAKAEFTAMVASLPSSTAAPVTAQAMAAPTNTAESPFSTHREEMAKINAEAKAKLKSIY